MATNHRVRAAAFLYCLVAIGLHLWESGAGTAAWIFLVLQFAVYPHLVYLRARASARPTRAELDNLLLDALLLGVWCGLLGFPLWIAYGLLQATALNAAVNRGAIGVAISLACSTAGAAIGVGIAGLEFQPQTSSLVTALAGVGALGYAAAIGVVVHRQNRRLAHVRNARAATPG